MGWKVYGNWFSTADFAGSPAKWQIFTLPEDRAIRVIRSWFVFFNNPAFTSIGFRIYSVKNDAPAQLLYTTDEDLLKAEMVSATYGYKNIWSRFTNAPYLKAGDRYALVPWITGYTGTSDSHVAWGVNFPSLIYEHEDVISGVETIGSCPYEFALLGARL